MKKCMCILMVLLLLTTTGALADVTLREYREECPHLFMLFTASLMDELKADGQKSLSAICVRCDQSHEILLPWASGQSIQSGSSKAKCKHVFRLDEEIVEEGVYSTSQISGMHEYRYLFKARCEKCEEQIDTYIVRGPQYTEWCDFVDTGIHCHIPATEQHFSLYRCEACGATRAKLDSCAMFDIGLCTMTLREMGYLETLEEFFQRYGQYGLSE